MIRLLVSILCVCQVLAWAAPRTDVQLKARRAELKKLESDLARERRKLQMLKTEEKSVLNTISLLDQNLNSTREYLVSLSENENAVALSLQTLSRELDKLDQEIAARRLVMQFRISELYKQGKRSEAEMLYKLLRQNETPSNQIYFVKRILFADKQRVESLERLLAERQKKRKARTAQLSELKNLREKKSVEETELKKQISGQEQMLSNLKTDQQLQQQALKEFERNQKTMLSLIKKLEEKRRKEIAEAKRKKELEKKKKKDKVTPKPKKEEVKEKPSVVVGPKCMPLEGDILSQFGLQDHPVLHIPVRNLGMEIRGRKGAKIKAAAAGTVALVSEIDGRGPSVIIEHAGGVYSVYGHLEKIQVKEGQSVSNCQEIGTVGNVASLNGIKLYFQVSAGTEPLDPLKWLNVK